MAKAWKVVRRTRSGRLRSLVYLRSQSPRACVPEFGPRRDVEYVPGKPAVAPRPEAPLFACRTLEAAGYWAWMFEGEVWRCETKPVEGRGLLQRALGILGRWTWKHQPFLVNEVTLIERVEA